jgi:16S rRNA (adenine1518-N6/adenine1519-N6)-dimethyltransferase
VDPKKSLGQHWLHDAYTLDAIVGSVPLNNNDTVLEIGPGLGTLTKRLLTTGANVIAIEYDQSLLAGLQQQFSGVSNFSLVQQDILKTDFTQFAPNYKIVANIPYYLTSHLLRLLGDTANKPLYVALLMQKEVTQRVCAVPPKMSVLSIAMQSVYNVAPGIEAPAAMFTPPPKVDSSLLVMQRLKDADVPAVNRKSFMRLVKVAFAAKRKTLRNTVSVGYGMTKDQAEQLLTSVHIDANRRAETLAMTEWYALYSAINK